MDVDRYASYRVHQQNDEQQWVGFNRATGARMSAMEHLVPEEMYSTEDAPANGISAVKAIQLAAAEGQRIWTITRDNLEQAMAASQLSSEIKTDIRNSVRAGREVTAHERPVSFFGKQSTGYIVLDPATGAGAYVIGTGENGGWVTLSAGSTIVLLGVSLGVIKLGVLVLFLVVVTSIISSLVLYWKNVGCSALGVEYIYYALALISALHSGRHCSRS